MTREPEATLRVKVVSRTARDEIAGWVGDALKVRVTAGPERGEANAAVRELIAAAVDVPPARVHLIAGAASARKQFALEGLTPSELEQRLARRGYRRAMF